MNHSFTPRALEPLVCATCSYDFVSHTKLAHCEACNNIGECDIKPPYNKRAMLLCESCSEKELTRNTEIIEQAKQAVGAVSYQGDYWNAKITPIVELREVFELTSDTPFQSFHQTLQTMIEHFQTALLGAQDPALINQQGSISKLVLELRAETRTKLKETDIEYKPPTKAPKVSTPRQKKLTPIEMMANNYVAQKSKQGVIVTMEQAIEQIKRDLGVTT